MKSTTIIHFIFVLLVVCKTGVSALECHQDSTASGFADCATAGDSHVDECAVRINRTSGTVFKECLIKDAKPSCGKGDVDFKGDKIKVCCCATARCNNAEFATACGANTTMTTTVAPPGNATTTTTEKPSSATNVVMGMSTFVLSIFSVLLLGY